MKKLVILLTLLSSSMYGQIQDFEGIWASLGTDYLTAITINEDLDDASIFSFSFLNDDKINETLLTLSNDSLVSHVYNPNNNHKVKVKYNLIHENLMTAKFSGDENLIIKYVRIY